MLNAAEARLAGLQVIDQGAFASKFGAISGGRQQYSGFALNVQGAPLPGVVTADKGATGGAVENQKNSTQTVDEKTALSDTNRDLQPSKGSKTGLDEHT